MSNLRRRGTMNSFFLILVVIGLSVAGYAIGRARSVITASGDARILHSLPSYYGMFVALGCGLPAILLLAIWLVIQPQIVDHIEEREKDRKPEQEAFHFDESGPRGPFRDCQKK